MVRVVWSRRALADLRAIQSHIRQFRPLAAQRMAQRLWLAGESLSDHPERGRTFGAPRELAVVPPYVIHYRIHDGVVQNVRIKHGAQRV